MHRIIKRQLEHAFGSLDNIPANLSSFIKAVEETYEHFDEDRELLDRSLNISSKEFLENSRKLREAKEKVEELVKKRTLELEQEKSRLVSSIESLNVGFAIFNSDGSIFKLNEIFKKMFHLGPVGSMAEIEQQIGLSIKGNSMLNEVIKTGREANFNDVMFEKKYLKITVSPIILGGSHEVIGAVMIAEDTTKAKEIEKAKTEFIILASHQLRTPLTVIKWHTNLLAKKIEKLNGLEKEQEYIEAIEDGCIRMSELIEDLLNVTRIEAGKLPINFESVNFENICRTTVTELQPNIQERELELKESYQPNLPDIQSDKNLIKMIVHNLLTNSIKYTPDHGTVKIDLTLTDDKNNFLLSVSDNGYGIPLEEQSKIFTKLFRADNIKLTKSSGTGLGLYITKSVVENFGGKIWFKSTPAQLGLDSGSTTFFVSLPITNPKL